MCSYSFLFLLYGLVKSFLSRMGVLDVIFLARNVRICNKVLRISETLPSFIISIITVLLCILNNSLLNFNFFESNLTKFWRANNV